MVKKVRKPGQARVKTSKMAVRTSKPVAEITRKQEIGGQEKAAVGPEEVNIDDIILK